jgi:uncharacterized protein YjbJ (UPF0337 family)
MNWKIIAIIAATAIATAAAVVFILQKQSCKRKMRFDSTEFDDDDFMDDIACADQCSFMDDSVDLGDKAEEVADDAKDAVSDAADKVEDAVEKAADAVEEAIQEVKDSLKK